MLATIETLEVAFQGFGAGDELMGSTQANFAVLRPGFNAREVAVFLNNPAADYVAGVLGLQASPEARLTAARQLGEAWVIRQLELGYRLDPVMFLSRSRIESDPVVVDRLRAHPGRLQPQRSAEAV